MFNLPLRYTLCHRSNYEFIILHLALIGEICTADH